MKHLITRDLIEQASRALDSTPPPFAKSVCGVAVPVSELTARRENVDCPRCLALDPDEDDDIFILEGPRSARPAATSSIEGAEAAGRTLGVSGRTIRRWLARCPKQKWPSGSQPGQRSPVWLDEEELRQWWATRNRWATTTKTEPTTTKRKRTNPSHSKGRGRLRKRLRNE